MGIYKSIIEKGELGDSMKVSIIGCKITLCNSYDEVYQKLVDFIIRVSFNPVFISINNVHTVVEATLNKKYQEVINNSFMALPDGKPLSVISKLKGIKNITRIFGPTFFEKTLEWGQKDGLRHFFFGSSKDTLNKMKCEIERRFPLAVIAGLYSPPYREFSNEENDSFIKRMNESEADIFWIGLGAPKQELWMYENYKKLNKGVMVGIGAGFDYLARNTKHAPEWMKDASLEWLYRLFQEPKRLWKRYMVTNSLFLFFITLEFLGLKKFED